MINIYTILLILIGLLNGQIRATNTIYFIYDNENKLILSESFD